jgi:hypothetical protein
VWAWCSRARAIREIVVDAEIGQVAMRGRGDARGKNAQSPYTQSQHNQRIRRHSPRAHTRTHAKGVEARQQRLKARPAQSFSSLAFMASSSSSSLLYTGQVINAAVSKLTSTFSTLSLTTSFCTLFLGASGSLPIWPCVISNST